MHTQSEPSEHHRNLTSRIGFIWWTDYIDITDLKYEPPKTLASQVGLIISSSGWSPAGPQCGDGKQTATREWLPAQCNCSLGPAWAATHMPCCRAAQRPSMGDGSAGGWARVDSIVDSDVGCARMKDGQRVGERRDIIIFSLSDGNEM